jgi:tetratricopeptide (TPR) repeat protein
VAILEEAGKSASGDAEKTNIEVALRIGYLNIEDHRKLLEVSAELAKRFPESTTAFFSQTRALNALGRSDEAAALAQERLKRMPNDLDAMRGLVEAAVYREDYRSAYDWGQKIVDAGKAKPFDFNNLAWHSLFFDRAGGPDVDAALKAVELGQNNPSHLHTLGCVYAAAGKPKEARAVLLQAMDLLGLDEPNPDYWYALGLNTEQYGLHEIALSDYAKVAKPREALKVPGSSYHLAQARMRVIRASAPANGQP